MNDSPANRITVLGVSFYRGDIAGAVDETLKGGLLTVPAAPALINLTRDREYREALWESDVVIPDSGCMTLVWNLLHWRSRIARISGLAFLRELLGRETVRKDAAFFLVCPTRSENALNREYLKRMGIDVSDERSYVAPMYPPGTIEDATLATTIENTHPDIVLINIGGGTQEKLGHYLKDRLSYTPAIICVGAAIAFLTRSQVGIPPLVDRLYLGWLWRCASNPKVYVPRYLAAFRLAFDILRFGSNSPHVPSKV